MRLDPRDARALATRGNALNAKGDSDGAIADYDEAIRLNSKDAHCRGVVFIAKGSLAAAQADFAQANALDPKYAYAALWLDVAERRNGLPSTLPELSVKLDMTAWPAPRCTPSHGRDRSCGAPRRRR